MGYDMDLRQARFRILSGKDDAALAALKNVKKLSQVSVFCSFINKTNLKDALWELGWDYCVNDPDYSSPGRCRDIFFNGECMGEEADIFEALAPFVKSGSYIEMIGEDGEIWRWAFENGKVRLIKPKLVWPKFRKKHAKKHF